MRKNTMKKSLNLNKITITTLTNEETASVKGGGGTFSDNNPRCNYETLQSICHSIRASC